MSAKALRCLVVFFSLSMLPCFCGSALDEDNTMGSANVDDFDDQGESTEDRTLAPNEYEGDSGSGAAVVVEEQIPLGGSGGADGPDND